MIAVSAIRRGETLIVWKDGYTDRAGALQAQREGGGIMQWDDDVFSYKTGSEGNTDQYAVNHSCDPTGWMSDAHTITARRDIRAGEEITADYAFWETDETYVSPWICACGSPLCRERIAGKDWMDEELRERYRGHFSPLINKRIAEHETNDR